MEIILPEECAKLPEGIKSRLRKVLYEFSKIKWFTGTRTFRETDKRAEILVRTYLSRLLGNEKKASKFEIEWIEGDWALADSLERKREMMYFNLWNEAGAATYRIAAENNREAAYNAIWKKLGSVVPFPNNSNRDNYMDAYDGLLAMSNYAASIVVEDIVKSPNLNEPLVELYLMGLWPRGIVSNKFILFAPVKSWDIKERGIKKEDKENVYEKYKEIPDNIFHQTIDKVIKKRRKLSEGQFKAILKCQETFLNTGGLGSAPADFRACNLAGYCFPNLNLSFANFYNSDLSGSFIQESKCIRANFERVSFFGAEMRGVDMTSANFNRADLSNSTLSRVTFNGSEFIGTCFRQCLLRNTSFINCDLSNATGLDEVVVEGAMYLDIGTLRNSKGRIPMEFLKNSNISDDVIEGVRREVAKAEGHTVFISYKHESVEHKEWVKSLANRLLENGVLAFLDQWEVDPGDNLTHYMEQGIKNSKYAIFVSSKQAVSSVNKRSGMISYEAEILERLGIMEKIKIIPILRGTYELPKVFEVMFYLDFNSDDQKIRDEPFNELVHTILGHSDRPLIGTPIEPDQPAK